MLPSIVVMLMMLNVAVTTGPCFLGCQVCQATNAYVCTQCYSPRYYNRQTASCNCPIGMYQLAIGCQKCPNYCLTCNSSQTCTGCTAEKHISGRTCLCNDGNNVDSQGECSSRSSLNIGLVLGCSAGTLACIIFTILGIYMYKKSRMRINDIIQQSIAHQILVRNRQQNGDERSAIGLSLQNSSLLNTKKLMYKQQICSICLDGKAQYVTLCGHYFHEKCIFSWINKKNTCPNCIQEIDKLTILKWCISCKKQLIYPRYYIKHNNSQIEHQVYSATCFSCYQQKQKEQQY